LEIRDTAVLERLSGNSFYDFLPRQFSFDPLLNLGDSVEFVFWSLELSLANWVTLTRECPVLSDSGQGAVGWLVRHLEA
jgi:hypothetical protein